MVAVLKLSSLFDDCAAAREGSCAYPKGIMRAVPLLCRHPGGSFPFIGCFPRLTPWASTCRRGTRLGRGHAPPLQVDVVKRW